MKNILWLIFTFVIVLFAGSTLRGQQWDWKFPKAGSNFHKAVKYTGGSNWLVAGEAGAIFRSTDDGLTWRQVYTPLGNRYFDDIFVLNNSIIYAIGTRSDETPYTMLIKSTDGGINWYDVYATDYTLTKIWFTSEMTGFALSGSYMQKTTDGGVSWSELEMISPGYGFTDIQFITPETGFLCGGWGAFAKTTDGGNTWNASVVNLSAGYWSVHFISPTTGFLGGVMDSIYKTSDGGLTWSSLPLPEGTAIEDIEFSGSTGYAAGWFGSIYRTTNTGLTWVKEDVPSSEGEYIYSVAVKSPGVAITAGAYGVVYTRNNSSTWLARNPRRLGAASSIAWPTAQTGFATIGTGYLLSTSDGGENWSESTLIEGVYTPEVIFADQNHGVIFTWSDTFYYTVNRGGIWQKRVLPSGSYGITNAFFATPLVGYAVGAAGLILKTIDGGLTWSKSTGPDGANLQDLFFFDANTGIICSYWNGIHKTTDGGVTWTRKAYYTAISVSFPTPMVGYSSGSGGYMLKTTNGGEDWFQISAPLYSIASFATLFTDEYTGFVSGPHIYRTTDGGISWYAERDAMGSSDRTVWDLELSPDGSLWAASSFSGIHKLRESPYAPGSIIIPEIAGGSGNKVVVPVTLDLSYNKNFNSLQFTVSGYGSQLTYDSLYTVNTISGKPDWFAYANPAGGMVRFSSSGTLPHSGGGVIVNLCFTIASGVTGRIPINFTYAILDDGAAYLDTVNGGVSMLAATYGDVDLNGQVQAYDASLVQQYILGLLPLNAQQRLNANVTTDAEITSFDASVILRYVVGLITELPYSGSAEGSALLTFADAILMGEQSIDVPLRIMNSENVYSIDAEVSFDSEVLEPALVYTPAQSGIKVLSSFDPAGKIRISFASAQPLSYSDKGDEIMVRFTPKPGNAGLLRTQIILEKARINETPAIYNSSFTEINLPSVQSIALPEVFSVHQNYPNPFNPLTRIRFELPADSRVDLTVYKVNGEEVFRNSAEFPAGTNYISIDGSKFPSGIYFARLQSGPEMKTIKMILNK